MSAIDDYEQGEVCLYGELTDFGLSLFYVEYTAFDEDGNEIILRPVK